MTGQRALIAAVALGAVTCAATAQEIDLERRIDSIFAAYNSTHSPGCALGVIRDGQFVFQRGYGMANLDHGIALTPASVFRIGSTSKQFTAAAVLLLAEEGKLSLDDDVRRFLPELKDHGRPVTIRQLLHHTSGVRDYLTLMMLAGKRDDDFYTDDEVVALLARQRELNFPPGQEYLYSNSGYFLLSQIVERASGKSLREYAQERIFRPLGMTHTHFHDDHTEIVRNRATGYAPAPEGGFRISATTLDMVGDGGVFTPVEDLLKWDRNFYEPKIGGERFIEGLHARGVLTNGDTLAYAAGLVHGTYRGLRTVSHGGSFVGFRAQMMRFPEQRFTVICLCNVSAANPTRLARSVADIYLEDLLGPAPTDDEQRRRRAQPDTSTGWIPSRAELSAYPGEFYSDELDVVYHIRLEGDSLMLTVGSELDGALRPADRDSFRRNRVRLRFERDDQGQVTGFVLETGRVTNLRFRRTG